MNKLDEIICPRCKGHNTQNTDDGDFLEDGDESREYRELWWCYQCDAAWLNVYRLAEQTWENVEGVSWVG